MKTSCIVYYDRWRGWSIFYNEGILQLGFLPEQHQSLVDYCDKHCKRQGFSIGVRGWEL